MRLWSTCFMALFLALFAARAQAESMGAIVGSVRDAEDGMVLDHAQVYIAALNMSALWGADGRFTIADVPAGEHLLAAELIGYETATTTVLVVAGETATVGLELMASVVELEEVVVTGTAFKESPISLPYAVAVTGREKMEEQGSPQLVDFFKNLGASHGVIGERSSWYNAGQAATLSESIANVNLRGLGASRTLVLINSRRQTYVPARLIGGRFVDVNAMPAIAMDRVEVLKEGASAIYGSDAVAGVANFLTRSDFEGFEVSAAHEHFSGAGDTNTGAIWGGKIGSAHAVVSAEWRRRQELRITERSYLLQPWHGGGQRLGWSSLGNPGTFAIGSPTPWTAEIHAPRCEQFGGFRESWTCRFRYQPWDNLIERTDYTRAFAELNGSLNNGTEWHLEGLWSEAEIPDWYTTPSYPPFPLTDTSIMQVAPDHPGRQAFCADYGAEDGDLYYDACQGNEGRELAEGEKALTGEENWYFNGRPFGNSGPERTLGRTSRTWRVAASANGDFASFGSQTRFDLGLSYSRTEGNYNLPGVYVERLFLGFRGFGGPDCGVGVTPDRESLAGMQLGAHNGQVPGVGDCQYYNPFSNAIEFSQQPGSEFENSANPGYRPNLANSPELRQWLNQEVDLLSTADMLVADATLTGSLIEEVASYAVGYQFRLLNAKGDPNDAGDVTVNPCPVIGDTECGAEDRFGPYAFTNVHRPYEESQTVHRFFAELPLSLGSRFETQLAANYEFHDVASSFDPKFGWRYQIAESASQSLFVRGSVQTTFRTPSLDDVNESPLTTLEWINETGAYQAVDRIGSKDLKPEQAVTYNVGLVSISEEGFDVTFDYWSYNFSDVIGSMPHGAITALYDENKAALQQFIVCPDGRGTGTCSASQLERVQVDIVNWPGVKTSGIDLHLGQRSAIGGGELSLNLDGTYTLEYRTKALKYKYKDEDGNLVELPLQEEADVADFLNFGNPIATSLPRLKSRASAGYYWGTYSLVSYLNYISPYYDRGSAASELFGTIDASLTWDMTFLWNVSKGVKIVLSGVNLLNSKPPLANIEQGYDGFVHDPKGRRLKLAVSYGFGG